MSGFFEEFAFQRIQIFGRGETAFLRKMYKEKNTETLKEFFAHEIPCCIFTQSLEPVPPFSKNAEENGCPILQTDLPSSEFSRRIIRALSSVFAEKKTIHGTLVEVFGIGILILGDSGVGKSETALELIERGHRLIADDSVEIRCVNGNLLMGAGTNMIAGHHMEIRGLGIININHLFGVGAIRDRKQIQLIVELEDWNSKKIYDRVGSGERTLEFLGVSIPAVQIPVKPGRNIPIIIETAAMNERLKKMGYYSAKEFNRNILSWARERKRSDGYTSIKRMSSNSIWSVRK